MLGKILGRRYELVEKVGEGGMGLVYKAKDHLLNRFVAVKILKPELTEDEEFINKFKKESLSSASLSHPNIVNIYDVGVEDGIYYIVMEFVKGKTLKQVIKEKAPMLYSEVISISRQICLALEHAHNNNIVHRDVKPQNILITQDGIVKVTDFGIARASSSSTLTNTGSVIGSAYYISPEQARGGYTDGKADIYSLGTVMYEMATGRVPFQGESPVVVALKHIQEEVVKPSEINPDVPAALEDIILKALEKNSSSRYETAAAMIKDLDRASADPDSHLNMGYENPSDVTKVMPAIKDSDLNVTRSRKKGNKKKINKWVIAIGIIMIAVIAGSAVFVYLSYNGGKSEVAVPNIIGQDQDTANRLVQSIGCKMEVKESQNSDQPAGTVIHTWPDVGMNVKKGSIIYVRLSAGLEKVTVPDVKNLTQDDAVAKLQNNNLDKGNVVEANSDTVPKGNVISQSPEANSQVPSGSTVDLVVSSGPSVKLTTVPQLVGVDFSKVPGIISQYKLTLDPNIAYDNDPSLPNNAVTSQSIIQGTQVPEGTQVTIKVNKIVNATP